MVSSFNLPQANSIPVRSLSCYALIQKTSSDKLLPSRELSEKSKITDTELRSFCTGKQLTMITQLATHLSFFSCLMHWAGSLTIII